MKCGEIDIHMCYHHAQFNEKTKSLSQTVFLASTNAVYTQTYTHITIALGEKQCAAFHLKSKHIVMILPLMDVNAVLMTATRFILDTYSYFGYSCITITQTNIYRQLASISFLCTTFFVFYLLNHRFAWYQDSSACLAINGGNVRSVSAAPDGCSYCCSRLNMDRVPGLPPSAACRRCSCCCYRSRLT